MSQAVRPLLGGRRGTFPWNNSSATDQLRFAVVPGGRDCVRTAFVLVGTNCREIPGKESCLSVCYRTGSEDRACVGHVSAVRYITPVLRVFPLARQSWAASCAADSTTTAGFLPGVCQSHHLLQRHVSSCQQMRLPAQLRTRVRRRRKLHARSQQSSLASTVFAPTSRLWCAACLTAQLRHSSARYC